MRVFVYWNLHKGLWSVKALEGPQKGRVVAREPYVAIYNASPKVSEAGRQRVLMEKRKNVHAGVVGTLAHFDKAYTQDLDAVTYNPYKGPSFYWRKDLRTWEGSPLVYLEPDRLVLASRKGALTGPESKEGAK